MLQTRLNRWILLGTLTLVIALVLLSVPLFFVHPLPVTFFWSMVAFLGLIAGICWITEGVRMISTSHQLHWYLTTDILVGIKLLAVALLVTYGGVFLLLPLLRGINVRETIELPFFFVLFFALLSIFSIMSLLRQELLSHRLLSRQAPLVSGQVDKGQSSPAANQRQGTLPRDRYQKISLRIGLVEEMLFYLLFFVLFISIPITAPFSPRNWIALALLCVLILTSVLQFISESKKS